MIRSIAAMLSLLTAAAVTTETVEVRGHGTIDLVSYACTDTPRSTVVQRVCYDRNRLHLLVNVAGAYSEYCRLPAPTFEAFVVAPSMGRFLQKRIAAPRTPFACDGAN